MPRGDVTSRPGSGTFGLVSGGIAPSTAARYLATRRSILAHAVGDERVTQNAAASVRARTAGHVRRGASSSSALSSTHLPQRAGAPTPRWYEPRLAGLPLKRSVLASSQHGELFVDTLKESDRGRFPWSRTWFPSSTRGPRARRERTGSSPHRKEGRSASRTGSARSAGRPPVRRSGIRPSGCTTCGTRVPHYGSTAAPTRSWCSGSSDTPPRRRRWTSTDTCLTTTCGRPPRRSGAPQGHHRPPGPGTQKPQTKDWASDLDFEVSRLSESNRRPIHYE